MPWSTRLVILIRFAPMQRHRGCSHCSCQEHVFLAHIWGDTELAQAFATQAKLLHANKIFTPHRLALGNIYLHSLCGNSKGCCFFLKAEVCNKWHPFKHTQTLHFSTFCLAVLLQPQLLYFVMKFIGLCIPKLCVCVDCYCQGGLWEKKQVRCSNLITGYNKSQDFFQLILI